MRVRTTSRDPRLRLLLLGVAWLASNLWVSLKAQVVADTARGYRAPARRWLGSRYRLDRLRDLLIEAIKARCCVYTELHYPFPLAAPVKL